jgi:hypothetical protein
MRFAAYTGTCEGNWQEAHNSLTSSNFNIARDRPVRAVYERNTWPYSGER